jgi:hypothetical protein
MAVIPDPPYSPDLAPCDFIFPNIKLQLNWDAVLIPLRRSRPNRRESLTLCKLRTSKKSYKKGGDGGTVVYMREGSTYFEGDGGR